MRVCKVEEKVERGEMFPHLWIVRLGKGACVYKVEEKMERGEMSPISGSSVLSGFVCV